MRFTGYLRFTLLISALAALFIGIGYFFGGMSGAVIALVFAGVFNFISYYKSDKIVLKLYNAQEATQSQFSQYHDTVEALARDMDLPKPALYVMEAEQPNAFATGRNPENSAVCVTHGLLQHLSQEEMEGVLAHELAHIKNRDTAINTAVATIVSAISMIGNMLAWSMLFGRNRGGGNALGMLFGVIVAPLLATMIQLAISRSREFTADTTAAEHTNPGFLASALQKIEALASQAPLQANHNGTAHLFIANPFRKQNLAKLFSTHPPTDERVQRLQALQ